MDDTTTHPAHVAKLVTTGQRAVVRRSIIAGQPWSEAVVDVIAVDGDTLTYTTDGIWTSIVTDGPRSVWALVVEPEVEAAARVAYRGGVFPAIQPGDPVDIMSLYPAELTARLAAQYPPMVAELPSSPLCPVHGADCEAWS